MATTHEDPAEAIRLLEWIQRLLRDSSFTTTYKFALLHALCDLALELAPGEHRLPLNLVAERVVELYWSQPLPFGTLRTLKQSTGKPATALSLVTRWNRTHSGKYQSARTNNKMPGYAREMLVVLRKDVLRRLQPTDTQLLYAWPSDGATLHLMPGVPQTLRRFHGLLTDMIQVRWTAFVERVNPSIEGSDALRSHLFGARRESLRAVVPRMLDLQEGRCFYSRARLGSANIEVDHFLPWSLTHNNSVGNLVLATESFNRQKSDRLPTNEQRSMWESRNQTHALALQQLARDTGLLWNPQGLSHLADWAFSQAS